MNRMLIGELAELRLREAQVLFDNRLYSGAYYLAGYAIECGLKACICRNTRKGDFPLDRRALEFVYTHDLEKLVRGAGLTAILDNHLNEDPNFAVNWALVKDWSEEARYQRHGRREVRDSLTAISAPASGIMEWLRIYW